MTLIRAAARRLVRRSPAPSPRRRLAGEINVLDPGGYGAVTITKSIRIISDHIEAGVLVSGTNGIVVNVAPTDNVLLEGLDIEGVGSRLERCPNYWRRDRGDLSQHLSIILQEMASISSARITREFSLVQNSVISNNGGGVNVQGAGGAANNGIIDNTTIDSHTNFAVQIVGPGIIYLSSSQLIGAGPKLAISGKAVRSHPMAIM